MPSESAPHSDLNASGMKQETQPEMLSEYTNRRQDCSDQYMRECRNKRADSHIDKTTETLDKTTETLEQKSKSRTNIVVIIMSEGHASCASTQQQQK